MGTNGIVKIHRAVLDGLSFESAAPQHTHGANGPGNEEVRRGYSAAEAAVIRVVPERFRKTVRKLLETERIEELRFRVGRPAQALGSRGERLLTEHGAFTRAEAETMLETICGHSVYSMENELCAGYVALDGGARVGLSGKPVFEKGAITRLTAVSSFNIRVPREARGCAEGSIGMLVRDGLPVSAIIASPPGRGKTTFLRDCARCFSNGIGIARPLQVAVADERNELSGSVEGIPTLDIGIRTDVMACVPKSISIPMLIRSMSPDIIITDEMSGDEELRAVAEAAKYGVAVIASVHAGSVNEVYSRAYIGEAISNGLFEKVLLLRRVGERTTLFEPGGRA